MLVDLQNWQWQTMRGALHDITQFPMAASGRIQPPRHFEVGCRLLTSCGTAEHFTVGAASKPLMPVLRLNVQSFASLSMALSIFSSALSLFFYVGDNKPFIVLTSAVPISMIAGLIATAAIAYESLKEGTVPVRCWGAFALAVAAYAFGEFVIRDYASGYSILQ